VKGFDVRKGRRLQSLYRRALDHPEILDASSVSAASNLDEQD
jgi:hypothetical protein